MFGKKGNKVVNMETNRQRMHDVVIRHHNIYCYNRHSTYVVVREEDDNLFFLGE